VYSFRACTREQLAWRRFALFFFLCCGALQPGGAPASSLAWRAATHKLHVDRVAAVLHASRRLHAYLDAGAWHVQQLARLLRQPAALQRLRRPAAPPSIFFSHESVLLHAPGQPPCILQPGGAFCLSPPRAWRCWLVYIDRVPSREMRRCPCYAFTRNTHRLLLAHVNKL
jgi:hypothetical protein